LIFFVGFIINCLISLIN